MERKKNPHHKRFILSTMGREIAILTYAAMSIKKCIKTEIGVKYCKLQFLNEANLFTANRFSRKIKQRKRKHNKFHYNCVTSH